MGISDLCYKRGPYSRKPKPEGEAHLVDIGTVVYPRADERLVVALSEKGLRAYRRGEIGAGTVVSTFVRRRC